MEVIHQFDNFHESRLGHLSFGLGELVLALILADLAIGSGDWWQWILAIILLFGFLINFIKLIGAIFRGFKSRTAS